MFLTSVHTLRTGCLFKIFINLIKIGKLYDTITKKCIWPFTVIFVVLCSGIVIKSSRSLSSSESSTIKSSSDWLCSSTPSNSVTCVGLVKRAGIGKRKKRMKKKNRKGKIVFVLFIHKIFHSIKVKSYTKCRHIILTRVKIFLLVNLKPVCFRSLIWCHQIVIILYPMTDIWWSVIVVLLH